MGFLVWCFKILESCGVGRLVASGVTGSCASTMQVDVLPAARDGHGGALQGPPRPHSTHPPLKSSSDAAWSTPVPPQAQGSSGLRQRATRGTLSRATHGSSTPEGRGDHRLPPHPQVLMRHLDRASSRGGQDSRGRSKDDSGASSGDSSGGSHHGSGSGSSAPTP